MQNSFRAKEGYHKSTDYTVFLATILVPLPFCIAIYVACNSHNNAIYSDDTLVHVGIIFLVALVILYFTINPFISLFKKTIAEFRYDPQGQRFILHHLHPKKFPPRIIKFDEIQSVNFSQRGVNYYEVGYRSAIAASPIFFLDLKFKDPKQKELQISIHCDVKAKKALELLGFLKKQNIFEVETKDIPIEVHRALENFQQTGKVPFYTEIGPAKLQFIVTIVVVMLILAYMLIFCRN